MLFKEGDKVVVAEGFDSLILEDMLEAQEERGYLFIVDYNDGSGSMLPQGVTTVEGSTDLEHCTGILSSEYQYISPYEEEINKMSNLNVKKVLVETSKENFTAGKEYEVFKEAGYTYIVDEVNDRLYFDLENKTFGYFNEGNVDLFSFRRGDLTIVEVQADKVPRCITLKDIEEGKIKVGDRVEYVEGMIYSVERIDLDDLDHPLLIDGYGWVSSKELYSFKRVNVAVEYLDFQEDREPLATYDSEDVEIVEEGGKLVVYSKENK